MTHDIHTAFLNKLVKENVPVTVFLNNGVRLQGYITHFDAMAFVLRREAHSQLIYTSAVSNIMPALPIEPE